MIKLATFAFLLVSLAVASEASASTSPLAIGLFPPIQVPSSDSEVTGLRLSLLVGKHSGVSGIDFGLLGNITEKKFEGLAVSGLFNHNSGVTNIIILQAAGIANINAAKTNVYGFQVALVNINRQPTETEHSKGFAVASGLSHGSDVGWEYGAVYGMQLGIYNSAAEVYGFQIGLINSTNKLHGIQIGLINFNKGGPFEVCPVFNVGF
jgi:hypothetical protein